MRFKPKEKTFHCREIDIFWNNNSSFYLTGTAHFFANLFGHLLSYTVYALYNPSSCRNVEVVYLLSLTVSTQVYKSIPMKKYWGGWRGGGDPAMDKHPILTVYQHN